MSYEDLGYNTLLGVDSGRTNINSNNNQAFFEAGAVDISQTTVGTIKTRQGIQSANYVPGISGWKIYGTGAAEFQLIASKGYIHVYSQDTEPTGGTYYQGDLWYDTNDGNKRYVYKGGAWVVDASLSAWSTLVDDDGNKPDNNATLGATWNANISGQPSDASITNPSYITSTKITSTTIESPTITACNITGTSTITGAVLQTSASSYTGVKIGVSYNGITVYDQALYFSTGSTQCGYIYATSYSFSGFSGNCLALVGSPYDSYIASSNRIWLGSQFVLPKDDNYEYLGCSTTSSGGGQSQDKTWKYIGGQIIDAKDLYKINNITCIDQSGNDVYFCGNNAVYLQGSVGTTDIQCNSSYVKMYHDTQISGSMLSSGSLYFNLTSLNYNSPNSGAWRLYASGNSFIAAKWNGSSWITATIATL